MQNTQITNLEHELKPNTSAPTISTTMTGAAKTLAELAGVTLHDKTTHVQVMVETVNVRVSPEGGTPTAIIGQQIAAGEAVLMSIREATLAKWIVETGTATLQISQYA